MIGSSTANDTLRRFRVVGDSATTDGGDCCEVSSLSPGTDGRDSFRQVRRLSLECTGQSVPDIRDSSDSPMEGKATPPSKAGGKGTAGFRFRPRPPTYAGGSSSARELRDDEELLDALRMNIRGLEELLPVVRLPSDVVGLCCVAMCFLRLSALVLRVLLSGEEGLLAFGLARVRADGRRCACCSWLSKVLPVALALDVEAEATGAFE